MYKPLPDFLTIKKSPIEGLGLYATKNIKANCFIGLTHIQDNDFENGYIRTPLEIIHLIIKKKLLLAMLKQIKN